MKTVLVITSYRNDGQIESLYRAYLPNAEESAIDQAADWFNDHCTADYNTEIHHTPQEITHDLMRECFPARKDLILACARICALDAVDNGAPAIPEEQTYRAWSDQKDAFAGDYDFLRDVAEDCTTEEIDLFANCYLKELFNESPTKEGEEDE